MDEGTWLRSDDPSAMLAWVTGPVVELHALAGKAVKPSDRKLRLVTCASARSQESFHPEREGVIIACEQIADGKSSEWGTGNSGLVGARKSISAVWGWVWCCTTENPLYGLRDTLIQMRGNAGSFSGQEVLAAILRDLVGNPFRRITLGSEYDRQYRSGEAYKAGGAGDGFAALDLINDEWLTPQVNLLAGRAYEDRLPDGTLDPLTLAAVADAMEEAGCPVEVECDEEYEYCGDFMYGCEEFDAMDTCTHKRKGKRQTKRPNPLLAHLRSPGPHWRGCWAIDLLLGKE